VTISDEALWSGLAPDEEELFAGRVSAPPARPPIDEEALRDMALQFNTPIKDKAAYDQWLAARGEIVGRSAQSLRGDAWDYDVQGVFAASAGDPAFGLGEHKASGTMHGTSVYKKPSHPTFSSGSVYHEPGQEGGEFVERDGRPFFIAGPMNRKHWSEKSLREYFSQHEPGVELVYAP
jgi:hypothetical protein